MTADQVTNAPAVYQLPITARVNSKQGVVIAYSSVPDDEFTRTNFIGLRWSLNTGGYASRTLLGPAAARRGRILLRVLIFEHYHGLKTVGLEIDHIDRNRLNNMPTNLRAVTRSVNRANSRRYRNNKSGFKGVHWHKRDSKWIARIQAHCRIICLGNFNDPAEAARAVNAAYQKHYPEVAIPNPHAVEFLSPLTKRL